MYSFTDLYYNYNRVCHKVVARFGGGVIGKFVSNMRRYFAPILIAVLVVCIVVLILNLDIPEKATDKELEYIAPAVVTDLKTAEPVQPQTFSPALQADKLPPSIESGDPNDLPVEVEVSGQNDTTSVQGGSTVDGLVSQNQEKLEKRKIELADMKAMLSILEEINEDPDRIQLYRQLVDRTEKEILELQNDIARYDGAIKE